MTDFSDVFLRSVLPLVSPILPQTRARFMKGCALSGDAEPNQDAQRGEGLRELNEERVRWLAS